MPGDLTSSGNAGLLETQRFQQLPHRENSRFFRPLSRSIFRKGFLLSYHAAHWINGDYLFCRGAGNRTRPLRTRSVRTADILHPAFTKVTAGRPAFALASTIDYPYSYWLVPSDYLTKYFFLISSSMRCCAADALSFAFRAKSSSSLSVILPNS